MILQIEKISGAGHEASEGYAKGFFRSASWGKGCLRIQCVDWCKLYRSVRVRARLPELQGMYSATSSQSLSNLYKFTIRHLVSGHNRYLHSSIARQSS